MCASSQYVGCRCWHAPRAFLPQRWGISVERSPRQNPVRGRLRLPVCLCSKNRLVESSHHQRPRCQARGTGLGSRSPPLGRRCRMPVVREKIANRTNLLSPWLRDPQKKKRKKGWRLRAGCGTYQADGEKRSGADKKKSSRISKSRAISASQSNVGGRSKSSSCGSWFSWSVGPMRRITKTKHGGKERQHTTRALVGEP